MYSCGQQHKLVTTQTKCWRLFKLPSFLSWHKHCVNWFASFSFQISMVFGYRWWLLFPNIKIYSLYCWHHYGCSCQDSHNAITLSYNCQFMFKQVSMFLFAIHHFCARNVVIAVIYKHLDYVENYKHQHVIVFLGWCVASFVNTVRLNCLSGSV